MMGWRVQEITWTPCYGQLKGEGREESAKEEVTPSHRSSPIFLSSRSCRGMAAVSLNNEHH